MIDSFMAKIWEKPIKKMLLRRGFLEPTTKELIQKYLELNSRQWLKKRQVRESIAYSAIQDYLEEVN